MKLVNILFIYLFTITAYGFPTVPPVQGSYCTPDDPDFLEYRYDEHIPVCKRNVTYERKVQIALRDGITDRSDFTIDHNIPLSLGGSNKDDNLWTQHKSINVTSDEYKAYKQLRDGQITREKAVTYILNLKFRRNTNE